MSRRCWPAGQGGERSRRSSTTTGTSSPLPAPSCASSCPIRVRGGAADHDQRALHRRRAGQGRLGSRHRAGLRRRPGAGTGLRQRELHRPGTARRAGARRGAGPGHRRHRGPAVPGRGDPVRVLRRHPAARRALRPGSRQRPVQLREAARPAAQPGRPLDAQPLHHQVPDVPQARRPARGLDQPVHDGRPGPLRPGGDGRAGRPGRGRPAAHWRAPPRGRHRGRHRPAGPAPHRTRDNHARRLAALAARVRDQPGRRHRVDQRILARSPRERAGQLHRRPRPVQRP